MKFGIGFLLAATTFGCSFTSAARSDSCLTDEATFVEENLEKIETWTQFSTFYLKHRKCDVSALRYAYTQQVVHLTASDKGLVGLAKMLAKHPQLKPAIFTHWKSESVSTEDRDQILKAVDACRVRQRNICREVRKILDAP